MEEAGKLKAALDALGSDMQTILSLLLNPAATEKGGMLSYHYVILKILEIADDEGGAELVDFKAKLEQFKFEGAGLAAVKAGAPTAICGGVDTLYNERSYDGRRGEEGLEDDDGAAVR